MPIYEKNQIIMVRYMPGFIKRATTLAGFCMAQKIAKVIMRNCPQTSIYAQCIHQFSNYTLLPFTVAMCCPVVQKVHITQFLIVGLSFHHCKSSIS
jgi:hypothetical protein